MWSYWHDAASYTTMASSSSSSYTSPCAACKFLRRKCLSGCIFAPYFPPEEPQKFANVHKIFGASNVTKLLNEILPHQREDAVNSLAYEAEARVKDPVYGCVGAISFLQRQVQHLQKELDAANADLIRLACSDHYNHIAPTTLPIAASSMQLEQSGVMSSMFQETMRHVGQMEYVRRLSVFGGSTTGIDQGDHSYQNPINTGGFNTINTYALPWSDSPGHVNEGTLGDQSNIRNSTFANNQ